ncbi:MAG: right-handed parallel beta-helix repeat-containing protein [Clostridia bacterium]|nr:right-handed parallel beta-helix repeat-containing protein [Clostridia bacterium]
MAREYHVSKTGHDKNAGTVEAPFLTISRAAALAEEGDTVIVHEGTYREWVKPANGARSATAPITYTAAEGEHAVIKGSEILTGWTRTEDGLWTASVDNAVFGDYNPYATEIDGDWMLRPLNPACHTGMVYLDGEALVEALTRELAIEKAMSFYTEVRDDETVFFVNFAENDPCAATVEYNVRRCCFYPEKTGLNYITVRGFEMAHGATGWAPPTTEQFGILGVHWAKGWVIENNVIHDARCSAVSLGKEISTGDNYYNRYHRKPGYQCQLEVVFAAKRMGWSRETVGSHLVHGNTIYNCGQNAIVGHMGGAFSEICYNHIYNIGKKREFFGYEIAGIKLHAALDTQIHHNHIHDCTMGTWLDWQAQGVRVHANVYHHNVKDIWFEVTHGPHLVDNNIFGSKLNMLNAAQGGAYVHNLFCGGIYRYDVIERSTPYHYAHSTDIKGTAVVYGADDRFYNNIFLNTMTEPSTQYFCGTFVYNGSPASMEEYIARVDVHGKGDVEYYMRERQPAYMANNYYGDGTEAFEFDRDSVLSSTASDVKILDEEDGVYLEITLDEAFDTMRSGIVTTETLGMPRITEEIFEDPNGMPITVDGDLLGAARGAHPKAGPIEALRAGTQKIKLLDK